MWIRDSSCEEKFEFFRISESFITDGDAHAGALLGVLLLHYRFPRRIKVCTYVFNQHPSSELYCEFHSLHQRCVISFFSFDSFCVFFSNVFNKFVRLCLRINHQWPSSTLVNNYTIFCRSIILRKSSNIPGLNFNRLSQKADHSVFGIIFQAQFL